MCNLNVFWFAKSGNLPLQDIEMAWICFVSFLKISVSHTLPQKGIRMMNWNNDFN